MGNAERFSGRVALVTGGSSGIGAAAARRLLDEGAQVASFDLDAEAPEGVLALAGDVARVRRRGGGSRSDAAELGPIDVLVCSAGVPGASLPTVDVTDEEWRRVMGINADGVFFSQPRRHPEHGRARLRADRQRRLDRREGGQSHGRCLLGVEGRRDRA